MIDAMTVPELRVFYSKQYSDLSPKYLNHKTKLAFQNNERPPLRHILIYI